MRHRLIVTVLLMLAWAGSAAAQEGRHSSTPAPAPPSGLPSQATGQSDYQLRAAEEMLQRGYLDAAVVECLDLLKREPANQQASELMIKALVKVGNWSLTITTLKRLMELDPNNIKYPRMLATISEAYDMSLQEVLALESVTRLEPDNGLAYKRLGSLYSRLFQSQEAARCLQRAAQLRPEDGELARMLASTYRSLNRFDERVQVMERITGPNPSPVQRSELAQIYLDSGSPQRGLQLYQELAQEFPGDPDYPRAIAQALFQVGNAYYDHEQYATASKYYDRAAQAHLQDPAFEKARLKADRLLNPSVSLQASVGSSGPYDLQYFDVGLEVPLREADLSLGVYQSWRSASDPQLNEQATLALTKLLATYQVWKDWRIVASLGTSAQGTMGGIGADFVKGRLQGSFGYLHDFVYETPRSIGSGLDYNEAYASLAYAFDARWSAAGDLHRYNFSNDNSAWLSNFSLGYAVILDPQNYSLNLRYLRSDFSNAFEDDQRLRFGPKNFSLNSLSLGWQQRLSEGFRYQVDYVNSWTVDGERIPSYRASLDLNLDLGSNLFLQYERGASARGVINAGTFNNRQDYRVTGGLTWQF